MRSVIISHNSESSTGNKLRFKQLQEIEKEIPWDELVQLVEPYYLISSIGRNLTSAETMVRIYFLQLHYGMSSSGIEEALFQIEILRDFSLIDKDAIPMGSCVKNFNQLISEQNLMNKVLTLFDLETLVSKELHFLF